jgi:trehalose 6-phosphate synthase
MKRLTESAPPLILVSNRGPVEYTASDVKRGSGGLVTALTGLASHRDAIWVASAMSEQDVEKSAQAGGRPFTVQAPQGGEYRVRFVASDPDAYDRFYNVCGTCPTPRTSGATRSRRSSSATTSSTRTWPAR